MFSILNEIEDNSHSSTTSVITGSIGSAASIYLLVAITGYLSYGDNVNGNIISMCKFTRARLYFHLKYTNVLAATQTLPQWLQQLVV